MATKEGTVIILDYLTRRIKSQISSITIKPIEEQGTIREFKRRLHVYAFKEERAKSYCMIDVIF